MRVKLDPPKLAPDHPILVEAERQLIEYFANKRTDFDLPLEAQTGVNSKRKFGAP